MILYDWTMGRTGSKNGKDFQRKIDRYLNSSNIKGDINCKVLILAPDFFLQEYFDWWRNHRNKELQKTQENEKKTQENQKVNPKPGSASGILPEIYLSYKFTNVI